VNVLVTGASGHIGGAIARLLRDRGHAVRAAVRAPECAPEGCEPVVLDLARAEPDRCADIIRGCDAVVHAAAWMGDTNDTEASLRVNIMGTFRLLEASTGMVQAFILISGLNFLKKPLDGLVSEDYPVEEPADPYALGKLAAESLALQHMRRAQTGRVVMLRPSSPVGPGLRRRRFFSICCEAAAAGEPIRLHGRGTRLQDYVDARDIARAALAALERPDAAGIYHIGAGIGLSNLDLARRCVEALNSDSPIVFSGCPDPEEGPSWTLDIRRAARELGYAPAYSLDDAIRDYAAWRNLSRTSDSGASR